MSPGHPHVSFGSLWKSLGSGYTRNSLCVTKFAARTSTQGRPTTLGGADEGQLSASRAHIHGCRRQVRVAYGDCAYPQIGSSKIRRRVGPPALLQCSDLGRSVRRRRRTAGCRQSSTPLRSMATKAASVANRLIIIAVGMLPMPAAMVDGRIALVHHESGLGVQPVN